MATITPSVVNSPKETMTSKGGYLRLTITSITDSDAETNKRYIGCKLTIEGTRWVGLYRWESTLGGQTVSTETRTVENWYPGHVLGTKNLTFDNDSAGNLSLTAYIKHIFYKGSSSWNTSYAKSITETLVCSQLPRYANFTSHSATSTLNTITVSYAADAIYGAQQYSLDGGNWTDCTVGSYTLNGFTPGSSHTIKTRIQRSDSGLWTESDQISISLKNLPTSNNVSNVNFNSNGTRVDASISSKDYLSQWYIKIYDGNTLVKDGSSDPNYASSISDYWTIQNSDNTNMLNRHDSTNSWTLTVKFYVVSNNTTYELSSKTCACTIPSGNYLPIYNSNNLSYAVQNSESNNITGSNQKVIKGISDVRIFTTQASPQGGASMSSYTATSGTKSGTSTSLSNTYIDLFDIDSNSFSVQATDTRGRSTVASKSYSTYIDYFAPYINSGGINISRVDGVTANLNISISGKYMNWSGLSTSNTITQVAVQYKLRSSQSWTTLSGFNLSISASNGNFTASGITTSNVFDISNEYDIKIILKDKLKNVEANGIIYTANVLLWKDLTNHRLGIGKKPNTTLDINGIATINTTGDNYKGLEINNSPDRQESAISYKNGNKEYTAGYGLKTFDGFGIYSHETAQNVFTVNKSGNMEIGTIKTKNLFNINGNINVKQNNGNIVKKNFLIDSTVIMANSNGNYDYGAGQQFTNLQGKTFTFSAKCSNLGTGTRGIIGIGDNYNQVAYKYISLNEIGSITYTATTNNIIVSFSTENGENACFTDIQVELGNERTSWVPYQNIEALSFVNKYQTAKNSAGWYRTAIINDLQTNVLLTLSTGYFNSPPSSVMISILTVYSAAKISQLNAVTFSNPSITKVRVQYDSSTRVYYVDFYYTPNNNNGIYVKSENVLDTEVYIFEPYSVNTEYTTVNEITITY